MKRTNKIIWGSALVIFGIVWIVCICMDINILFDGWWTLFIIVPSLCGLIGQTDKTGPAIGLGAGVLLLLAMQGIIDWDMFWKIGLAILIIAFGLGLIFGRRPAKGAAATPLSLYRDGKDIRVINASFGEQKLHFDGERFEGADITASFASVHIDLRHAVIDSDVTLNLDCKFAGLVIYAPGNLTVKMAAGSTFGGVDDKRRVIASNNAHMLYISGSCLFSGIEIQ